MEDKKRKDSLTATRVKNTVPSHALADYAGNYFSPVYGNASIELQGNQLWLQFRSQRSLLHHFHYDQFTTDEEANGKPDFRINFITANKGDIDKLTMQPYGDPLTEFVKNGK